MTPPPTLRQLLIAAAAAIVLVGGAYLAASFAAIWAEASRDEPVAQLDDAEASDG